MIGAASHGVARIVYALAQKSYLLYIGKGQFFCITKYFWRNNFFILLAKFLFIINVLIIYHSRSLYLNNVKLLRDSKHVVVMW